MSLTIQDTSNAIKPMAVTYDTYKQLTGKAQRVFKDGRLVQLHIGRWQMTDSLSPTDLDFEEKDVPALFSLGTKRLIDPKVDPEVILKFSRIESRARTYLKDSSFPFPIAHAHFVPLKRILRVQKKLVEYRDEFIKNLDTFALNYEDYKKKTMELHPNEKAALESSYPTIEKIRGQFSFIVSTFEMAFPKNMSKQEIQSLVVDLEEQEQLREKLANEMELELKRQQDEALKRMESFIPEAARALRQEVITIFTNMAQKLKDGKVVSSKNITSMKNVIDTFEQMNFYSDDAVKAELDKVQKLLNTTESFKDNKTAVQELSTAIGQVLNTTSNMNDIDAITGTYFRNLNLGE